MNYPVIAEHLTGRTSRVSVEQREETQLHARVRLDPHLAPGASIDSKGTARRYLRSPLEHPDIIDEAKIEEIARWWRGDNLPVGLWNEADQTPLSALRHVKAAGPVAGVISNSAGSVHSIIVDMFRLQEMCSDGYH